MKVDEKKYRKKVKWIALASLAAYAIVFGILLSIADIVFYSSTIHRTDTDIRAAAEYCATNKPLDVFDTEEKFSGMSIAYFDANGKLLINSGSYYSVWRELGDLKVGDKCSSTLVDGLRYRTITVAMQDGVDNKASIVKIYYPLESTFTARSIIMKYVAVAFAILLVVVVVVSYFMSTFVAKPYIALAEKNNQLIFDTAHELNTPLAVISSQVSNVVNAEGLDEPLQEQLYVAKEELQRMKRMVKDMLALAKVENDMLPLNITSVEILSQIEEICEPYQVMAEDQCKEFVYRIDDIVFNTDADRVKQMMHIMLDNALKYTREGESITVEVTKEVNKLKLMVADTGLGVPQEQLEKIFNKFYRVDDSRTKSSGGTGIGLALLKASVYRMGGKLTASINSPKGLRLEIWLPEKQVAKEQVAEE